MSYKKTGRKRSSSLKKGESILPLGMQSRLNDLFMQIEREFESLYLENLSLQEKLENVTAEKELATLAATGALDKAFGDGTDVVDNGPPKSILTKEKGSKGGGIPGQQKVALRLKQQTSKIVSSFKTNLATCSYVKEFAGHKDGIWDVTTAKLGVGVIGTASADHKAGVFAQESGRCLLRYEGHKGSVNSIRFHPTKELALTASGDHAAHIWQASVAWEQMMQKGVSSEEEFESSEKEENEETFVDGPLGFALRTPSLVLNGHSSVVICADWLSGGDQVITASWDRTACLWDSSTGEKIQTFYGHDQELSYATAHPVQKLVVTTSKDATFRMWDLRSPCYSVSVFQGHTDNITSALFTKEDRLVSGSDDRTVKVWDIRNMRACLVTIRLDSAVNRLAVSPNTSLIAVPQDDRHVRVFDLTGQRLARLPRSNRQGHRRMVTSAAWCEDQKCNLFTCGFDRVVMAWNVQLTKDKDKDKDKEKDKEKEREKDRDRETQAGVSKTER